MTTATCQPYVEWRGTEAALPLDGVWCTYEQLLARIEYVEYYAQPVISTNMGTPIPNRWSDVYGAIDLWLHSQYREQWDEYVNEEGKVYVEENDWHVVIDGHLEDYGMQDIYEEGVDSSYAWMLGAHHNSRYDFEAAVIEWAEEQGLDFPEWIDPEDHK